MIIQIEVVEPLVQYYVRLGDFADIVVARGQADIPRRQDVVLRTGRGVEIGQVLNVASDRGTHQADADSESADAGTTADPSFESRPPMDRRCQILRPVTSDDRWLIIQLQRRRDEAVRQCQVRLAESNFDGVLLDVSQQFDGGTLLLHFMGSADWGNELTRPIIQRYEEIVRTQRLAERLVSGCGPNCGTSESACKGSCAGCAIADACGPASS